MSLVFSGGDLIAQNTTVTGRVIDASTREPVPFANVYFQNTREGAVTDFDGFYKVTTSRHADSLVASFIGYVKSTSHVIQGKDQTINFSLESQTISLKELVFVAGENPAYEILKQVVRHKALNDKRSLNYFDYDSYNRIEISIDNMTDKWRENPLVGKVIRKLDSIKIITDESGKRIIPVFLSECLSRYYVKNNPESRKEQIQKTRVSGIGVEDGGLLSQLIGSSFQEYNFYKNWVNILDKDFISPIADGWKTYYDYDLVDSMLYIDGDSCYRLTIYPKNAEDLAFTGTMWITKDTYSLKQIDVNIQKASNLNFIDNLKIQQKLVGTEAGPWLPVKTRVIIDVAQLTPNSAGFLVKFYNSNKDFNINDEKESKFYNNPIELSEQYLEKDPDYWEKHRYDTLTSDEKMLFVLVDSLQEFPRIKRISDIVKTASAGYYRKNVIDYGPVLYLYSHNNVEGNRVRLGLKTNEYLSKKFTLRGYGAYGFGDNRFKYGLYAGYIFNRKPWTELQYGRRYDIDQVGLPWDALTENYFFLAFTRFGILNQPYISDLHILRFDSYIGAGFSQKVTLRRETFTPLYNFAYYKSGSERSNDIGTNFINSTLSYSLRYARDETFVINGNQRISMGIRKWPAITATYTYGLKGVWGSDFEYHKLDLSFEHLLKLGLLGISTYNITAGKIFNPVPYPLLYTHIGNETIFYTTAAFSLMNYFEFVSDEYVSLRYQHNFEGFILNRIPLIRKLKWRLVGNANLIWGKISEENRNLIPAEYPEGFVLDTFKSLEDKPYIELGYGIENIFKVARIDFFHRLSYLDSPSARSFGIKISFQLIL